MFNKFLKIFIVVLGCFSCQAMDMDELRSRFLAKQPGGQVMQRDLRLTATVEILDSSDASKKSTKWTWVFQGPLPRNYASDDVLTEPILTALPYCPD